MGLNRLATFSCMSLMLILVWAGPAKADSFSTGQFVTYTQAAWSVGGVAAATSLLTADYNSVYQGTAGDLIVGVTGTPGQYFLELDSSGAVLDILPTVGLASVLTANQIDPLRFPSVFGGDVVALALDVDFSNAGLLGTSSTPFGDLVLVNFGPASSPNSVNPFDELNGLTVSQFLAMANTCLGGGSCPLGIDNTEQVALDLGAAFAGETPTTFAEDHLVLPSSTTATPAPEPSSIALFGIGLLGILGSAKFKR